jgi:hypothetical protein
MSLAESLVGTAVGELAVCGEDWSAPRYGVDSSLTEGVPVRDRSRGPERRGDGCVRGASEDGPLNRRRIGATPFEIEDVRALSSLRASATASRRSR